MKKKIKYNVNGKPVEKEYTCVPVRYIFAAFLTIFEILAILGIVVVLCYFIPYFYLAAWITQIVCVVRIISSDDNPDYKAPWLLFVLILPIAGFMLYFLFYSRRLKPKFIKRLSKLKEGGYVRDDSEIFEKLHGESEEAYLQAILLCNLSGSCLFGDTSARYFSLGEEMWQALLSDLRSAQKFIYIEYFIIQQGVFWDSIVEILKEKAALGVEVKVLYDDIGCMATLPGDYAKQLKKWGIEGASFSRLKAAADGEFNNRNHRKITVIDGFIAYTGGVNIADEYINRVERFGHWKDVGIRLEGEAVWELTRLFLVDFGMNVKSLPTVGAGRFPTYTASDGQGYFIPFGDGPKPLYSRRVGQGILCAMIAGAKRWVYITTPYLIIDNEMCAVIEGAALRGVRVKLITPHVPDKKLIFEITRSFYSRLMKAGVEIYEYEPGFIHAKSYLVDGEIGVIGTMNLDYRSLVHHFENGVWAYRAPFLVDMQADFENTLDKCVRITEKGIKANLFQRGLRAVAKIFAPLM